MVETGVKPYKRIFSLVNEIRVIRPLFGTRNYPGNKWREAIHAYLNIAWMDRGNQQLAPILGLGDVSISPNYGTERYEAYSAASHCYSPRVREGDQLNVDAYLNEVEIALARFLRDEKIRRVGIFFNELPGGRLYLTKGDKRSELIEQALGLPLP